MTLQQWFYIFGLSYMIFWLVIGLIVLVGLLVTVYKIRRAKQQVQEKISSFSFVPQMLKKKPTKSLLSVLAVLPVVIRVYKKFRDLAQDQS